MPCRIFTLASALLAVLPTYALAKDLGPGSPAPALSVKKWYKGTPVKAFQANKTYVVEFWATWCGPCKESIPHLTEIAHKNKDVQFIGVSIWEDDNGTNIKNFVRSMGARMDYNVGYSGNQTGMGQTWMKAAGQNGIPTAFVIKNRKVLWIGHPMEMEKPLAEIKSGKFNLKAFKASFDKKVAETRFAILTEGRLKEIDAAMRANKFAIASTRIAAFERAYPKEAGRLSGAKLAILRKQNPAKVDAMLKKLTASRDENTAQTLINVAMSQLDPGGDKIYGAKIMRMLVEAAHNGDVTRYYFAGIFALQTGDKNRALLLANRAIAQYANSPLRNNPGARQAFEELRQQASK